MALQCLSLPFSGIRRDGVTARGKEVVQTGIIGQGILDEPLWRWPDAV
jgi:hypothetical protein